MRKGRQHIYGPVISRRLGLSLGVDLVPHKTCDYDCAYCQLGKTSKWTRKIAPYVPPEDIIDELKVKLESGPRLDYVTMAGSGEPTLNSKLERIICAAKELSNLPVAVLTNGSLLGEPDVSRACLHADLVLPSLDAGDEETFLKVNRPCPGIRFSEVVAGMVGFRERYEGEIWLEVMLVEGINSSDQSIEKIRKLAEKMHPEEAQLNTVRRPPSEPSAKPVSEKRLQEIRLSLWPDAVIPGDRIIDASAVGSIDNRELLSVLRRRPCTRSQIADLFKTNEIVALKELSRLTDKNLVISEQVSGEVFYRALDVEKDDKS